MGYSILQEDPDMNFNWYNFCLGLIDLGFEVSKSQKNILNGLWTLPIWWETSCWEGPEALQIESWNIKIIYLPNPDFQILIKVHPYQEGWKTYFCHSAATTCCGSGNLLICKLKELCIFLHNLSFARYLRTASKLLLEGSLSFIRQLQKT